MITFIGYIGNFTLQFFNHIIRLSALFVRITGHFFQRVEGKGHRVAKTTLEQIYFTAFRLLPVIIPVALIIGSFLIFLFTRISGQLDLGRTTIFIVIREIGPGITALLVILRTSTAVAIEVGTMDAQGKTYIIRDSGLDPVRMICMPRLIGITVSMICLFSVFDLLSIIGGYGITRILLPLPIGNFLGQVGKAVTATDIIVGFLKAVCFGVIISVTSMYHGFRVQGDLKIIPSRASAAAIECFFLCLVANVAISITFYV